MVNSTSSSATSFNVPAATLPTTGTYDVLVHPTGATSGSVSVSVNLQGQLRSGGSTIDDGNALSTNLVGLFAMNEGSGATDMNLVDNQPATFSGTSLPTWNTIDPSILFQGGGSLASYLNAGADLTFDKLPTSKTTIVAKVFVDFVTAAGLVEKVNTSSAGLVFGFDSTGALRLTVIKSGGNLRANTGAGAVVNGQWLQLAVTYDGTVGTASATHLYVNGVEQTQVGSSDGTGTLSYSGATSQPFRIGNASYDFPGALNGKMAYVAVYRGRILSPTELNQLDAQLPVDNIDVNGPIAPNGAAFPVNITSTGQNARLLFTAKGGENATVQLGSNTLGSVTVSLLNSDGTTLTSATSSASSFTLPSMMAPTNGVYAVYVHPNGGSGGSINVTLTLEDTPSRPTGKVLDTSNPLATNLQGLFVMNEATGNTDLNLVDNQTASFSGSTLPTWNTSDPSIIFAGGGSLVSYLNAGADLAFDQLPTSKVTIVTKVYLNALGGGLCEKNDVNQIAGFLFGTDSTGAIHLEIEHSQTNMHVATGSGIVGTGQWVQVAFTWDGTVDGTASAHLFLNGVEQDKPTAVNPVGTLTYANATDKPFRLGNVGFHDAVGSLNGKMAYLAVYRGRILSTAELNQLDGQLPIH